MKKIVAIIGTNAVGKTTLARSIIEYAGGISYIKDDVTYCCDNKTSVIGNYLEGKKIAGVDEFGETKFLSNKIKSVDSEIVVFEGLKCGTFGLSIQSALFSGTDSFIIFLYASAKVIQERLLKRSNKGIQSASVLIQQKNNLRAAIKYKEIGVKVVSINTDELTPEQIFNEVKSKIYTNE